MLLLYWPLVEDFFLRWHPKSISSSSLTIGAFLHFIRQKKDLRAPGQRLLACWGIFPLTGNMAGNIKSTSDYHYLFRTSQERGRISANHVTLCIMKLFFHLLFKRVLNYTLGQLSICRTQTLESICPLVWTIISYIQPPSSSDRLLIWSCYAFLKWSKQETLQLHGIESLNLTRRKLFNIHVTCLRNLINAYEIYILKS